MQNVAILQRSANSAEHAAVWIFTGHSPWERLSEKLEGRE
jgi:hypothetical protein